MLDIKVIRQDPERVKAAMKSRNKDMDKEINEILEIDAERRAINVAVDNMKAEQNRASKLIPQYKKEGKDVAPILTEMKELSDKIAEDGAKLAALEERQDMIIHAIPNIPHESVPLGEDDQENVELRRWGEPTHFDYEPLPHWDLGADLGILDPETAAKVTGKRFHFYRGLGCRLERSIIAFFMDTHSAHGYTEIFPPFIANKDRMTASGQRANFAEDMDTRDVQAGGTGLLSDPHCRGARDQYVPRRYSGRQQAADELLRLFRLLPRRSGQRRSGHPWSDPSARVQ